MFAHLIKKYMMMCHIHTFVYHHQQLLLVVLLVVSYSSAVLNQYISVYKKKR